MLHHVVLLENLRFGFSTPNMEKTKLPHFLARSPIEYKLTELICGVKICMLSVIPYLSPKWLNVDCIVVVFRKRFYSLQKSFNISFTITRH